MNDNNVNNEALIFKELPKEQRKALQKEYHSTAEAKKSEKKLIIIAIIFAIIAITSAIISILTEHPALTATSPPAIFFCVLPAIVSQQRFEKWLEAEKGILMKRKKQK